jgi:formate-dependent phosphoribosylglycinamide formyltransferase (GAR transformylase)
MRSLGLMCGAGPLPARMAIEATRLGWRIVAFTFPGATEPAGWAEVVIPS